MLRVLGSETRATYLDAPAKCRRIRVGSVGGFKTINEHLYQNRRRVPLPQEVVSAPPPAKSTEMFELKVHALTLPRVDQSYVSRGK